MLHVWVSHLCEYVCVSQEDIYKKKRLATYDSWEWFLICIGTNVCHEIRFLRKQLPIYGTCEHFLICECECLSRDWIYQEMTSYIMIHVYGFSFVSMNVLQDVIYKNKTSYMLHVKGLSLVSTNVSHEIGFIRKWLPT